MSTPPIITTALILRPKVALHDNEPVRQDVAFEAQQVIVTSSATPTPTAVTHFFDFSAASRTDTPQLLAQVFDTAVLPQLQRALSGENVVVLSNGAAPCSHNFCFDFHDEQTGGGIVGHSIRALLATGAVTVQLQALDWCGEKFYDCLSPKMPEVRVLFAAQGYVEMGKPGFRAPGAAVSITSEADLHAAMKQFLRCTSGGNRAWPMHNRRLRPMFVLEVVPAATDDKKNKSGSSNPHVFFVQNQDDERERRAPKRMFSEGTSGTLRRSFFNVLCSIVAATSEHLVQSLSRDCMHGTLPCTNARIIALLVAEPVAPTDGFGDVEHSLDILRNLATAAKRRDENNKFPLTPLGNDVCGGLSAAERAAMVDKMRRAGGAEGTK